MHMQILCASRMSFSLNNYEQATGRRIKKQNSREIEEWEIVKLKEEKKKRIFMMKKIIIMKKISFICLNNRQQNNVE